TLVLSLLVSLIYDKFTKLDGLRIPADNLIGDDYGRQRKIYEKYCLLTPKITLLYMTPEKSFEAFIRGIPSSDSLLMRSTLLQKLQRDFLQVPFIALTATATPRIRTHILHHLKMKHNLAYEVQLEKSIQNCYAALPVDCYCEMAIRCLAPRSYEEELIPICQSFLDQRLSYLEDKEYAAFLNSEEDSEDFPYFSSSIETIGVWMSKSK
ncbi:Bloom syndrome protein -like protein, partial [Caligus rogercresseyi]